LEPEGKGANRPMTRVQGEREKRYLAKGKEKGEIGGKGWPNQGQKGEGGGAKIGRSSEERSSLDRD